MDEKKEVKRVNKIFFIILLMILIIVSSFIIIKKLYVEKTLTVSTVDNVYDVLASEEDEYGAYYKDGKWYYTDDEGNEVEVPTISITVEEEDFTYEGYGYIYNGTDWYLRISGNDTSENLLINMSEFEDTLIFAYNSTAGEYGTFFYDSEEGWITVSVDYSSDEDDGLAEDLNSDGSASGGTSYDLTWTGDYTSLGTTEYVSTTILKSSSGGSAIPTSRASGLYNRLKSDPLVYCNNKGSALPNVVCYTKLSGSGISASPYKAYVLASSSSDNRGNYPATGQQAWWGTGGGTLKQAANEFANYINSMPSGKYSFDSNGFNIAPGITFSEADETSVEFRQSDQVFRIGPFKLNYNSSGSYAGIDGATLTTNLGSNYTKGSDFWFESSDESKIDLPESGQTFYLVVKYDPNLTSITDLSFSYHYTNGYGTYDLYSGQARKCTSCSNKYINYNSTYHYCNGSYHHTRTVSIQGLVVVKSAAIYQVNLKTSWNGTIPSESLITINKEVVDSSGDRVNMDDTFYFDVYVSESGKTSDLTFFETLTVSTSSNGWGTITSAGIRWTDSSTAPYVVIVERINSDYTKAMIGNSDCASVTNKNIGNGNTVTGYVVYNGKLTDYANSTLEIDVQNVIGDPQLKDYIEINKQLVSSSGGSTATLKKKTFYFTVYIWRTLYL